MSELIQNVVVQKSERANYLTGNIAENAYDQMAKESM